MKTNQKLMVLGIMVLGVMLAGFNAKAADPPAFAGKFTLASETRWGAATLPAGDYSFTVDHAYPGSVVTVMRGTQTVARVQAVGLSYIQSGRSEILAEGGTVRAMNLPTIGVNLHYPMRNPGHRYAPREPQVAQTIAVGSVGAGR